MCAYCIGEQSPPGQLSRLCIFRWFENREPEEDVLHLSGAQRFQAAQEEKTATLNGRLVRPCSSGAIQVDFEDSFLRAGPSETFLLGVATAADVLSPVAPL
jgi:hypothetical protein